MHFDKWNWVWFTHLHLSHFQFAFLILDLSIQSLGLLLKLNVGNYKLLFEFLTSLLQTCYVLFLLHYGVKSKNCFMLVKHHGC
jgi:hypothetical protein